MLTFICDTCGSKFSAEIVVGRVIYLDNNRRVDLKNENQDCDGCAKEIAQEASAIDEQARARVRARKQKPNGQ